ncbi:protein polybromo-1 isoform X1 [Hydra vulgaris]|uniref:protein polybromo-1 isoform X1 n=1 Tax=Hydra vulgaris TaxID=6087 RepID=UPI001F5FB6B9|nr:protein polybromo-1 [Hydra vulgaris]
MPPKRRLLREDSESSEEYRSKRLRSATLKDEPEEDLDLNSIGVYKEIVDYLCTILDENDRPICEMFNKLPSKDALPVYYDIISEPIDFQTIKKKIKTQQYLTINDLEADIFLLIKNAHAFNESKSQIYKDATQLKKSYLNKKSELSKIAMKTGKKPKLSSRQLSIEAEDKTEDVSIVEQLKSPLYKSFESTPQGTPSKDDGLIDDSYEHDTYSILYNMVVAYTDQTGRRLSAHFVRLPHKRAHQSFYEVVKNPISLCKIRSRIKIHYYSDLKMIENDFNLVFSNALKFYPPDSIQYQDAHTLNAFMHEKIKEMDHCEEYQTFLKTERTGSISHKFKSESSPIVTPLKKRGRQPKDASKTLIDGLKIFSDHAKKLFDFIMEYKNSEGRFLFKMFHVLPDKKEFAEYYEIISKPIDLKTIGERINANHYVSEYQLMKDFNILFKNARKFNEEGSQIYNDSITLEKALKKKMLEFFPEEKVIPLKNIRLSNSSIGQSKGLFTNKCHELLSYVQEFKDDYGNKLSAVFEKLPSRLEYPDYYQLIKRPIDLSYISSRINKYTSIDDLEQDLMLLFNNACHYNEPDSQIYKDAIVLLRAMIAKKNEISPDLNTFVPDVAGLVHKLLESLYTSVMQHKDEEGRCYSDSLVEHIVKDDSKNGYQRKPISLIIIGQLLQLRFYKRLDRLQEDIFLIFNNVRKTCSTETEMYEDACQLQIHFIIERDRLTKDGLHFLSQSAINITLKKLQHEIDVERNEKQISENQEHLDELDGLGKVTTTGLKGMMALEVQPDEETLTYANSIVFNGINYSVGDFVYMSTDENNRPPHIVSIEKIWKQENGLEGLYGNWYFRPEDTFHLASRKFMEQEVFRNLHSSYMTFQRVIGKCYVMNVKDYPKYRPEGFEDKDVFVYESRYNMKMKSFKKVKTFLPHAAHVVLVERDQLLTIKRFSTITPESSQFSQSDKSDKSNQVIESTDGYEHPKEEHCKTEVSSPDSGCTYYEKYVTDTDSYKIGDGVYVKCDEDYLLMSKIDKIWTDSSGTPYFQGNWYLTPEDTKHVPTQLFYEKECFESTVECVEMLSQVAGKCAILNLRDYQFLRPTEIDEKHVYICSAIYIEEEMKFRRRTKGFKRAILPANVRDDELWYFDESINPNRRPSLWLMPWGEQDIAVPEQKAEESGYSLMKKEYTSLLMKENFSLDEAEAKALEKWNGMSNEEKNDYKLRQKNLLASTLYIYECGWGICDYQFEEKSDLIVHVMEGAHLSKKGLRMQYGCLWRGCLRKINNLPAFSTHSRLLHHIREVHFKNAGKRICRNEKSRSFFLRYQSCDQDTKESSGDESSTSSSSSLSPVNIKTSPKFPQVNLSINNPVIKSPVATELAPSSFSKVNISKPAVQAYNQLRAQATNISQQSIMNPVINPVSSQILPQVPSHQQIPLHQPIPMHQQGLGMSVEQQQMLFMQVQRQQQQIQQLEEKIAQLQNGKDDVVFVSPPESSLKLRHSEIYVRYIEGLRDNRNQLSNWSELANENHPLPSAQLPTHWFTSSCENIHQALWQLRDRMLRDAAALSKII